MPVLPLVKQQESTRGKEYAWLIQRKRQESFSHFMPTAWSYQFCLTHPPPTYSYDTCSLIVLFLGSMGYPTRVRKSHATFPLKKTFAFLRRVLLFWHETAKVLMLCFLCQLFCCVGGGCMIQVVCSENVLRNIIYS